MPPGGALSQGIGPHGPLRSVDDTPTTASACQPPWRDIPAPRRERHTVGHRIRGALRHRQGNPRPGYREPGLSPSEGGKREVPGSARGTRVLERRTTIRLQARRVHVVANRSRKHAISGAGTRPCARVGQPGRGRVTRRSGCSSSVASPPVEAGRAARGRGRRPTNDHRGGAIAAPSPPGRHRGRRQPASPRRAGSSGTAAGDTKPSPSSSVETDCCCPPKPARTGWRHDPRPSAPSDE
jgi:hypothetical protein